MGSFGFGPGSSMQSDYNNNNKLLREKGKYFKQNTLGRNGNYQLKQSNLSPEEIEAGRLRAKAELQKENRRRNVIIAGIVIIFAAIFLYYSV